MVQKKKMTFEASRAKLSELNTICPLIHLVVAQLSKQNQIIILFIVLLSRRTVLPHQQGHH